MQPGVLYQLGFKDITVRRHLQAGSVCDISLVDPAQECTLSIDDAPFLLVLLAFALISAAYIVPYHLGCSARTSLSYISSQTFNQISLDGSTSVWQDCSHSWRWRSSPARQIEIRGCAPENVVKVFASVAILRRPTGAVIAYCSTQRLEISSI